jgi:hypothetical protein
MEGPRPPSLTLYVGNKKLAVEDSMRDHRGIFR